MKILLISDTECEALWDYYRPERLEGIDLILSCGDVKPEYLRFLVTMANVPLLYVHGNHDERYEKDPPEGCDCIDWRLVCANGVRILGLPGCARYRKGKYQMSERTMARRLLLAELQVRLQGGVDIIVSHAPAREAGDLPDYAHRGFQCLRDFILKYSPAFHVHGHVHLSYGVNIPRTEKLGSTSVVNAYERTVIEIPAPGKPVYVTGLGKQ